MNDLMDKIKNLRESSGAGFMDCKKALQENNGDIEQSIIYLRKKGLAKAVKKSDRETNEGAVGIYSNDLKDNEADRFISLALTKYCSVGSSIRKDTEVKHSFEIVR